MSLYWYPITEYAWVFENDVTVTLYGSYISNMLSLTPSILPPGRKNGLLDISQAMKLMYDIVQSYNKSSAIKDTTKKIMFTPSYPDRLFDSEIAAEPTDTNRVVVWQLARREPGALSAQPFGRPKELKPRYREEWHLTDANGEAFNVEVRGQWWDNMIRYECWAPTSAEADELTEFFESFITETSNYVMRAGVQKVILFGRGTEGQYSGRTKWFYRTLNVYYRTEKITLNKDKAIMNILEEPIVFVGEITNLQNV